MIAWLKSKEPSEVQFWAGVFLLFLGLSCSVSIATALSVTGAVIVVESVITSYMASWVSTRKM